MMNSVFDTRPFIDGHRVAPLTDVTFDVINPHTSERVARVPACSEAEIDQAVKAARAAFVDGRWSGLAPSQRAAHLFAWATAMEAARVELATLDSLQMGMPLSWGVDDLKSAIEAVRETAALATTLRDELVPAAVGTLAINQRRPHGVVGVISPWNFPCYIAMQKVATALVMGNTVVLKPSEVAPLGCLLLAELASRAGMPPGVFNAVPGLGAQAGRALALHMDVDALTFTGSSATGGALMASAGQSNLKSLVLECGGKSPQIVFDDLGDLNAVADALVQGFTFNTGQVCVAGTRLLVHRPLFARLKQQLLARMSDLRAGDPRDPEVTMGPLANASQHQRVSRMLQEAQDRGVSLLQPGPVQSGLHLAPTLAVDLSPADPLMQEELFGPVAGLLAFDTVDEAIAMANDSRYGLMATGWTSDLQLAHSLPGKLRSGTVHINTVPRPAHSHAMHLGAEPVGQSGFGAEGGVAGLSAMTRIRSIEIRGSA
ncbi:aldehyde dehydrogenase family protein [Roseateles sp.]|jgi:acyl-CoA reductase-like NAD-dependent aldehyde dehydrogenase|uniref:aldehyde dehydrogenase family protein n=1 Tax=Roseateles sp. TaxID=1971397 RepID=UPI0037C93C56